jgi:GntR family transcriptional regulator/MocR family aminotransferase
LAAGRFLDRLLALRDPRHERAQLLADRLDLVLLALVLQAMARYAPQCRLVPVMGGGSYWVELPRGVAADDLAAAARAEGVLVEPGDVFFLAEPPPGGFVRLGYQSITPRQIEPGIKALAGVIARLESRA